MKKKILLVLSLVAVMTLLFAISVSAADPVETWDISATGNDNVTAYLYADPNNEGMYTLTISGTGNMKDWDFGEAPWYSSYDRKITSVTIESGVTTIGNHAFYYCTSITSIVIPESVTSIGNSALNSCFNLTEIFIPNGVIYIGDGAFINCRNLTNIIVGEKNLYYKSVNGDLYTKDEKTFLQYSIGKSMEFFSVPDSVEEIAPNAFFGWNSLLKVYIPNSVVSIGDYAFYSPRASHSISFYCGAKTQPSTWSDGWEYSHKPVVWGHSHTYENHICVCGKEEPYVEMWDISATENDNVTAYLYADPNNEGMYTLTISGTGKMKNWDNENAPWHSSYSDQISAVTIENGVTTVGDNTFKNCDSLTSVVIPDSVTTIGNWAFYSCDSLKYIEIGNGVINIENYAFSLCASLTKITVGENNQFFKSINGNLYSKDETVLVQYAIGKDETKFVIPDSVTEICGAAFAANVSSYLKPSTLKVIVIPDSVTTIGYYAFHRVYGPAFEAIYCEAESKPSGWDDGWIYSDSAPIVWDYKNTMQNDFFGFKGYSFGFAGQISFGFDIDYDALAKYEELTGKSLEIGVVFAGLDNLAGKQPLDQNGKAISLEYGMVVKADLTDFNFPSYDFVLFDVGDSIKDVKLVIAAYIYDGEAVKYVQENGISDIVTGISYNEAKESVE